METGIQLIATERQEQISKHKRTTEIDVLENDHEQLRHVAIYLLTGAGLPDKFSKWKGNFDSKSYKERLVIAGALIAAEIDRLQQANG